MSSLGAGDTPPELIRLMKWCQVTGRTYPTALIETFAARRNRFNLVRQLIDEHANPVLSPAGIPAGGGWKRVRSSDLLLVADTGIILAGAAVSLSRSWVDTVLHIFNQLFSDPPCAEQKVSVGDALLKRALGNNLAVYRQLQTVLHSDEYRYLNDLTNAMKHRELIHSKAALSAVGSDIVVDSFEKDGRNWQSCPVTEIVERGDSLFACLRGLLFAIPELAGDSDPTDRFSTR